MAYSVYIVIVILIGFGIFSNSTAQLLSDRYAPERFGPQRQRPRRPQQNTPEIRYDFFDELDVFF